MIFFNKYSTEETGNHQMPKLCWCSVNYGMIKCDKLKWHSRAMTLTSVKNATKISVTMEHEVWTKQLCEWVSSFLTAHQHILGLWWEWNNLTDWIPTRSPTQATKQIQTQSLSSREKCPIGFTCTGIQRMLLQLMQSPSFVLDDRAEIGELLYNGFKIRPDRLVRSQRRGTPA